MVIASPDVGGVKRVDAFRTALKQVTGRDSGRAFVEKYRSAGVVSGDAVVGDVEGRTVLLLDDMISSGTTLARAAAACREHGAARVWAAATHGLFTGKAESVLTAAALDPVVVTNTVPPFRVHGELNEALVVLDAAPMFAAAIRRIHEGGSIVELLELSSDCPTSCPPSPVQSNGSQSVSEPRTSLR
jgi:ribose-phosphate pyrophosphokinase